jgi:hypothetical protein
LSAPRWVPLRIPSGIGVNWEFPAPAVFKGDDIVSKGMNQKREQKKKPAKTLEEKRAAKKAKKAGRSPMPGL